MPNIVTAEFTSVWDSGYAVTTPCKVNMDTREVFDIETCDGPEIEDLDVLDREYVTINGKDFPVVNDEDMDEPEKSGEYWYKK